MNTLILPIEVTPTDIYTKQLRGIASDPFEPFKMVNKKEFRLGIRRAKSVVKSAVRKADSRYAVGHSVISSMVKVLELVALPIRRERQPVNLLLTLINSYRKFCKEMIDEYYAKSQQFVGVRRHLHAAYVEYGTGLALYTALTDSGYTDFGVYYPTEAFDLNFGTDWVLRVNNTIMLLQVKASTLPTHNQVLYPVDCRTSAVNIADFLMSGKRWDNKAWNQNFSSLHRTLCASLHHSVKAAALIVPSIVAENSVINTMTGEPTNRFLGMLKKELPEFIAHMAN